MVEKEDALCELLDGKEEGGGILQYNDIIF